MVHHHLCSTMKPTAAFRLRGQSFNKVVGAIECGILSAKFRERFGITRIDGKVC